MNKILKRILIVTGVVLALLVGTVAFVLVRNEIQTSQITDEYTGIYTDPRYAEPVSVSGASFIKQDISCGYAVIEMFARWAGRGDITEKALYDRYGGVVTSTGKSFEKEMNTQFSDYETKMYKNLKNTELIEAVYRSLSDGIPVPFEWAAKNGDEWTLHYSLITGMDVPNDSVVVQNPYGYEERIGIGELLERTSFRAYEGMPLLLRLGFAFGIFEKNTVFIVTRK